MSGGIDSTVTAMLMHEAGYEVIGITMKTWDYSSSDARQVSVDMGFHHFIVDIREEFGDYVIDDFVDEYIAGRTPNPCILCNTHIKWSALLKRADAMDCEFIATGHYAKINHSKDRYYISKAIDQHKDQSYVLWGLSQECMARTKFPLAPYTKPEIRQMAADRGYEALALKAESYEICFVPDNDYRGFLKRRVPGLEERVAGGMFVSQTGEIIGSHDGYPFYTIGQRKGLGGGFKTPKFVTEIRPDENVVVLGEVDDLLRNGMIVSDINLQKFTEIPSDFEALTMVRYNDPGSMAQINMLSDGTIKAEFLSNVRGVAPGQSAVFYEGDDVIGGGRILSSL
ncbi:UNVERIFIED_CONTAM: hypothetical protein GTU68_066790 [Idotea baltica]|nr:hypothetical protein [Idotea baltica]